MKLCAAKVKKHLVAGGVLALAVCADVGAAGLRFAGDAGIHSSTVSAGSESLTLDETAFAGELGYQHDSGFFGEAALTRLKAYALIYQDHDAGVRETASVEGEPYFSLDLAGGYRIPYRSQSGRYWGFGYKNTRYEDYEGQDQTFGIYWEKDKADRYGLINTGLVRSEDLDLLMIEGQHIWFRSENGPGIGLSWKLAAGSTDNDQSYTLFNLGAQMMFREGS